MPVVFFSDPHVGLVRRAHSTPRSRERLKQYILFHVKHIFELARRLAGNGHSGTQFVCLGDLVDTYSNDENVINTCLDIVSRCDLVLAGNHDSPNRADHLGTVGFISRVLPRKVAYAPPGYLQIREHWLAPYNTLLLAVPHHTTQTLFDTALDHAVRKAQSHHDHGHKVIVLLHCNYDNAHTEGVDTALNLAPAQAEALLRHAEYVLLGHEHNPRSAFDGRLQIVGNVFPTGFGDLSDKRVLVWDGQRLTSETIWQMKGKAQRFMADCVIRGPDYWSRLTDCQFLEISGQVAADQIQPFFHNLAQLWEKLPALCLVRNLANVTPASLLDSGVRPTDNADDSLDRLAQRIEAELNQTDPELATLYTHYQRQLETLGAIAA